MALIASAFVAAAHAQQGNWDAVKSLHAGTAISVKTGHWIRLRCSFLEANDDWLSCQSGFDPRFSGRVQTFAKDQVRQVRIERPNASILAGAAIGAGVGVGIGSAKGGGASAREGNELVGGSLFGLLGGFVGKDASIIHGKVIYEQ